MSEFIIILTTTDSEEKADKIASHLLEKRLAACVQIFPIKSYYRWKGKIENSSEFALFIKTKKPKYKDVEKEIKSVHSYETPEIISIPILDGSKDYLSWLSKEVG